VADWDGSAVVFPLHDGAAKVNISLANVTRAKLAGLGNATARITADRKKDFMGHWKLG
jgi:hypothetical protein